MKRSCLVVLMSLATLGSVFGQEFLSFTYQPFGYGKLDLSMLESEGFNRVLTLRNTDTTGEGFVAVDFYFTDLGSSNAEREGIEPSEILYFTVVMSF